MIFNSLTISHKSSLCPAFFLNSGWDTPPDRVQNFTMSLNWNQRDLQWIHEAACSLPSTLLILCPIRSKSKCLVRLPVNSCVCIPPSDSKASAPLRSQMCQPWVCWFGYWTASQLVVCTRVLEFHKCAWRNFWSYRWAEPGRSQFASGLHLLTKLETNYALI